MDRAIWSGESTVCIFLSSREGVHYHCLFCGSRMVVDFFLLYDRIKVSLDLVSNTYRRLGRRSYISLIMFLSLDCILEVDYW